jgi:hypothetical protein
VNVGRFLAFRAVCQHGVAYPGLRNHCRAFLSKPAPAPLYAGYQNIATRRVANNVEEGSASKSPGLPRRHTASPNMSEVLLFLEEGLEVEGRGPAGPSCGGTFLHRSLLKSELQNPRHLKDQGVSSANDFPLSSSVIRLKYH